MLQARKVYSGDLTNFLNPGTITLELPVKMRPVAILMKTVHIIMHIFCLSSGTLGTFGTTNTGGLFGTQNKPGFGTTFGTGTATNMFGNTTGTGLFGNSSLGFGTTGSTLGQTSILGGTFGQTSKVVNFVRQCSEIKRA